MKLFAWSVYPWCGLLGLVHVFLGLCLFFAMAFMRSLLGHLPFLPAFPPAIAVCHRMYLSF
jgi:hypothetical protein